MAIPPLTYTELLTVSPGQGSTRSRGCLQTGVSAA